MREGCGPGLVGARTRGGAARVPCPARQRRRGAQPCPRRPRLRGGPPRHVDFVARMGERVPSQVSPSQPYFCAKLWQVATLSSGSKRRWPAWRRGHGEPPPGPARTRRARRWEAASTAHHAYVHRHRNPVRLIIPKKN
jgi:hypothetical protein